MGFRLKLRESLPDGLKRVFREQIGSALKLCRHPARQRGVTGHEVRKHLKKVRAAMRLAITEVGKDRHAREDRCVRKIGRLVSDLRDAQVRLQTLIQLRDETAKGPEDNPFPRIEELLSLERESFSAAFAGWQRQAIPQLERVEALRDELAQLEKLIRKRGKRLRTNALELGRRFYAEPAKAFAKRISIFVGKRK